MKIQSNNPVVLLLTTPENIKNIHSLSKIDDDNVFYRIVKSVLYNNISVIVSTANNILEHSNTVYFKNSYFIVSTGEKFVMHPEIILLKDPLYIFEFEVSYNQEKLIEYIRDKYWKNTPKRSKEGISLNKIFVHTCFTSNIEKMGEYLPFTIAGEKNIVLEKVEKYVKETQKPMIVKPHNSAINKGIEMVTMQNLGKDLSIIQANRYLLLVAQEFIHSKKYQNKTAMFRVMVALYSFNPLKFYVHENSVFVGTSLKEFDKNDISNGDRFLTKSLVSEDKYFKNYNKKTLWERVNNAVHESLCSMRDYMNFNDISTKNFTTSLGYDFMLGDDDRLYILEINHGHTLGVKGVSDNVKYMNKVFKDFYIQFFFGVKKIHNLI